jgi:antitoxin (DNA-binding transcriptional repressor) of toxin-antitoxin stability system
MKVVTLKNVKLATCIRDAQQEGVVITRNGAPVALVVGLEGMDLEQVQLGQSDKFWKLVKKWRGQKTLTRLELEKRLKVE